MSEVTKRSVHVLVTYLLVTGTYIHPLNGTLSGTTQVSRYQKGKTSLDFTGARDSEWQWHQLGHMQVGTSLQTDNHASTPPFSFLQAGCPFCRPTNSVKALEAFVTGITLCPKKVSPLNILQQPPQTCTDLNEILHTQDDICFCHRRQIS